MSPVSSQELCHAFHHNLYVPRAKMVSRVVLQMNHKHFRIKAVYDNTGNAVNTRIRKTVTTYVSIATMKKQLNLKYSLY